MILGARVASAAGDAGLRARVLQATDLLERERPAIPLFTGVARHARGILERDAQALLAAADVLQSSSRPLLYAAAAEDAGAELARTDHADEALDQLNAAFDTYLHHEALADARRVGRELRRLGVQRRIVSQPRAKTGWDSLTDSELKVVNLIAQGATNRSVAQRAARHASHGESPSAQCVRQAGHQLPRPADAAHARVRLTSRADNGMAEAVGLVFRPCKATTCRSRPLKWRKRSSSAAMNWRSCAPVRSSAVRGRRR